MPATRTHEAGYPTAVYKNVYLDIGKALLAVSSLSRCGNGELIHMASTRVNKFISSPNWQN